jgi:hypothetical protein
MEQTRRHITEKAQDNITLFHQMIVSAGDHNGKGQSVTNTGRCIIKPVGRQQNQQKKDLEPFKFQVTKDGKTNFIILPQGAKILDTYTAKSGQQVMTWSK